MVKGENFVKEKTAGKAEDKKGVGRRKRFFFSKVLKGKGRERGCEFRGRIYKEWDDFESFSIVGREERVKKCEQVEAGRDGYIEKLMNRRNESEVLF